MIDDVRYFHFPWLASFFHKQRPREHVENWWLLANKLCYNIDKAQDSLQKSVVV